MVRYKLKPFYSQSLSFENLVLLVAIIEPLSTVPQIITTYTLQDATGVSLLSWLLFTCASIVWLIYGIKIKSNPLIASSVMWVLTEIILIVGIVIYS